MAHLRTGDPAGEASTAEHLARSVPSADPNIRISVARLAGEDVFRSFALRFQVYCRERAFLDVADYPEGIESDQFDWISMHIGAFDPAGVMVGTVRLVPHTTQGLPLDSHCAYQAPTEAEFGEISRLAVPRGPAFGAISLQLYRGLYQTARAAGMTHLLSAMEPSLERLVRRIHIPFEPVGPLVDYYGWVRPYVLDLDELDRKLAGNAPGLYQLFHTPLDRRRCEPVARREPSRLRAAQIAAA